jgi:hypothetical protein
LGANDAIIRIYQAPIEDKNQKGQNKNLVILKDRIIKFK